MKNSWLIRLTSKILCQRRKPWKTRIQVETMSLMSCMDAFLLVNEFTDKNLHPPHQPFQGNNLKAKNRENCLFTQ